MRFSVRGDCKIVILHQCHGHFPSKLHVSYGKTTLLSRSAARSALSKSGAASSLAEDSECNTVSTIQREQESAFLQAAGREDVSAPQNELSNNSQKRETVTNVMLFRFKFAIVSQF